MGGTHPRSLGGPSIMALHSGALQSLVSACRPHWAPGAAEDIAAALAPDLAAVHTRACARAVTLLALFSPPAAPAAVLPEWATLWVRARARCAAHGLFLFLLKVP